MGAIRRLLNLWRGRELARDFDDEIAFHFEQRIEANARAGMSDTEARDEARRHFGSVLRAREGMHEARVAEWLPAFGRDLRVASRMARRQPALAALALLTLSLGVGAVGAVFAFIDATFVRPLPYHDAERLVAVMDTFHVGPPRTGPTVPELLDLRAAASTLDGLSFVDWRDFQIGGGTEPARVVGARSEASLLHILGVKPALGRLFTDADGAEGRPVAILTDALWRANFAADPAVVGRRIILNGLSTEVVGVLPADFRFDFFTQDPVGVYVPFPMVPVYTSRAADFVNVRRVLAVARLKPNVPLPQAAAEVQAVARRVATDHPELYRVGSDRREVGFSMRVELLQENLFAAGRTTAQLVVVAAAMLLLLACVNMGQFLLAHALERRAEMAVRSALGAARGRLARQLGAESVVLTLITAAGGLLVGAAFIQLLRIQAAGRDPFIAGRIVLNGRVAMVTVGIAAAVALVCSLLPLVRLARSSPLHVFSTREVAPPTRGRHLLLAGQVAVTVTLLSLAGLLAHSITRLNSGDRGYVAEGVTSVRLRSPLRVQGDQIGALSRQYLERLRAVPDIAAVAISDAPLPLFPATTFSIEGASTDAATLASQRASYSIVSPDYFSTLGIPLRAGRVFTDDDGAERPSVAVVNEELVRRHWPGQQAIGRRIRAGEGPRAANLTIVGVVGNVRPAMQLEPIPQIYVSYLQQAEPNKTILIRTRDRRPLPLLAVKQAIWSVASDQPVFDVRPLPDVLSSMTAEPRRSLAVLLGSAAILALVISSAGMFTLVTYVTARRRREIALRRVIGAGRTDVLRLVAVPTLRWTCIGLAIGLAVAVSGGGILRASFGGVAPTGAALLAMVSALYLVIGGAAVCAPALGALAEDPASILRSE